VALDADLGAAVSTPAMPDLCGREGLTLTVLRPSGKTLVDGVPYDSISESGYVEPQTRVRVVRCEQAQIYVEAVEKR
jgi:membrane-bound serine protease (ClpP class)